ncbi:TerC family protein [Paenibacillus lutrae]|uniref:YjbE family putative metal transport protein n=1 Tax=Paenibacillus lutrae TaxID=2078573 RepID=A0A7X3JY07_9BACL|nr:TerC family protein [Paenibacillus lutrae]MVO98492.1 YjbE family putative metal transport protein [Paenibacillus lutrae]
MDWLSAATLITLLNIIVIDLVLAGDNAIVIGMAAKNVPKNLQKRVILWGTAGAVGIRVVATVLVVYLLKVPGLLFIGGLMLIWIAVKLLTDKNDHTNVQAKNTVGAAITTIIVADAAMGIDNVIAIAGAAHGHIGLVIIGLLISVPIIVWGSTLFIKVVDRFPIVMYIGSGVLAFTAAKMLTEEKFIMHDYFVANPIVKWLFVAVIVVGVLVTGYVVKLSGYSVKINDRGQLTLPKQLGHEANIAPEDSFKVQADSNGRLVLVKVGSDPTKTAG